MNDHIQTKTEHSYLGHVALTLTIEHDNKQDWDTKVEIEQGTICWVSGSERKKFLEELNEVIDKYRI